MDLAKKQTEQPSQTILRLVAFQKTLVKGLDLLTGRYVMAAIGTVIMAWVCGRSTTKTALPVGISLIIPAILRLYNLSLSTKKEHKRTYIPRLYEK